MSTLLNVYFIKESIESNIVDNSGRINKIAIDCGSFYIEKIYENKIQILTQCISNHIA